LTFEEILSQLKTQEIHGDAAQYLDLGFLYGGVFASRGEGSTMKGMKVFFLIFLCLLGMAWVGSTVAAQRGMPAQSIQLVPSMSRPILQGPNPSLHSLGHCLYNWKIRDTCEATPCYYDERWGQWVGSCGTGLDTPGYSVTVPNQFEMVKVRPSSSGPCPELDKPDLSLDRKKINFIFILTFSPSFGKMPFQKQFKTKVLCFDESGLCFDDARRRFLSTCILRPKLTSPGGHRAPARPADDRNA
jgi:hypothetical protein